MPSTQQNSILGVIAVVFIIAIIAVCFWPSCADKSSPPVQLTREKEAVNLASADIPKKHKEFFSNGLGHMKDMNTSSMEEEFKKYMTVQTGGGVFQLNKLQIQEEISRIIDDKTSVGTEFREEETPTFDANAGYNVQAVSEVKLILVTPKTGPHKGKSCKYNTQTKEYTECKNVQLNAQ